MDFINVPPMDAFARAMEKLDVAYKETQLLSVEFFMTYQPHAKHFTDEQKETLSVRISEIRNRWKTENESY